MGDASSPTGYAVVATGDLAIQGQPNQNFTIASAQDVAYGNGTFVHQTLPAGTYPCALSQFGSDPAPNTVKYCSVPAGVIQSAILSGSGSITNSLSWLASQPTWMLLGGGAAILYVLGKLFGGGGHR